MELKLIVKKWYSTELPTTEFNVEIEKVLYQTHAVCYDYSIKELDIYHEFDPYFADGPEVVDVEDPNNHEICGSLHDIVVDIKNNLGAYPSLIQVINESESFENFVVSVDENGSVKEIEDG